MIQIKHLDGTTVLELEIPEGALVHRELMGDHYISLKFTLATPVYLLLGDYVETNFGRFELTEPYSPKYDVETGGYNYDFQLDAHYIKWKNKVCRYNPQNAASETSFNLTANIATHLQVILSTINALGALDTNFLYNGSQFTYQLQGFEGDEKTAKYKQYQNTDIISALNDLASVFDSEWWVEDNIIYFGRCELSGTAETFKIDDNVHEMTSSESSNEYATRLFVFGSDKNLPSNYRKDESADITKNGVVQKRLMLPLASCPYGYLQDSSIIRETEAVEGVYIDEDIYPKVECKVSEVTSYEKTVEDEDTGESTTQTFYRVKDGSGFNFSSDYILEGETLHIIFQSGKMSGMDFECQYNDSEKYYEVVANEDYGRTLPDTSLHPEVGDEFVLYNWDATKLESTGIIATAESELLTAAQKKLAKLKVDPNTYTCKMDSFWYEKNRSSNASDYSHYSMGQKVKLINASCFSSARSSRIIGYEIKLDLEYDTPEYYVGEATVYSQSKDLQNQIDSITVNGASYIVNSGSGGSSAIYLIKTVDAAVESDTNAYSAARVKKQFADKLHDENISALWTLLKGLISKGDLYVGDFISGAFGKGALINSSGHAEVESLYSRSFISTPEFRFNRISVTEGENWCTNGYGTILDVDTENQIITLKLEENDYASVRLGDICRGIYNDLDSEYTTVDSSADECGFSTKKGFFTSYFYICEIITNVKGECKFKYQLRNSSTPHPCKFMKFAQYGSFTDEDRQSSSYSTSIGHAYEEVLEGVNTWIISDSMIVYRHGWLGTMQVHLKSGDTATLQGNGLYVQDNVYFGNAIVQLDPVSLTDIQQQLKQYSVEFSDYTDVITVDDVGNVIGGLYKVDRDEEGNITQKYDYRIHSAIYVKRGNDFLTLAADGEDAGTGTYKIYTQCDGCECEVVNSTLRITKINDVKDGIAGTADDDTFDYDAMRDRSGILVTVTIDCEGIGTISRAFPVAIKHDSQPYVRADLDNEFSGVSWNTKTQSYVGLPLTFNFKMWRNNDMLTVDSLAITGLDSAHYAVSTETDESGAKYKKVTINSLPTDMAEVLNLNVTGSATYSGISYERTLVHTINKSTDVNVYKLVPTETDIHASYNDLKQIVLSASRLYCNVECNSNSSTHYIVPATDFETHGLSLKYQITKTDGTTTEEDDYPTSGIAISTDIASVKFILHINGESDMYETVPVLLDGVDGDNAIRLTLDNENDNCLALEDGTVIESTLPVTYAALYDGDHLVTQSEHSTLGNTWQTLQCTNCQAEYGDYREDGWRKVKVTAVTGISAQVIVPCNYTSHGVVIESKAVLTIKKDIGTDKYEIITNPASVAYNPNTDKYTPEQVAVSVYKTTRETPRTLLESLPTGFALSYSTDGGSTWTSLTYGSAITKAMFDVDGIENIQIKLVESVTKNGTTSYVVRDLESVEIVGDGVDGSGVEYVFFSKDVESAPSLYDDSATEAFQKDDYCPYTDAAHTDQWTDEPTGVGANSKYEYYAQRKKVNGVWQAFSDVKMWDRYSVDGTSPYVLDLSNDQALINCDTDGTVLGSYETSEIMLFEGATDAFDKFNIAVTATNISCSRNGKVLTPSAITSDSATIAVKATLKTNTSIVLTAVYKINKTYKGKDGVIYSLVPSISTIHKDGDGNFIDTTMAMQVKKTVGTTSTLLSSATEISNAGLTIKYDSTTISDPTSISTSTVCGSKTYAQFYLYQGSTVIDRERINVVNNGEKGDAGVTINVSNLNINAKKSTSAQQFYVRVKVNLGKDQKLYANDSSVTDGFLCSILASSKKIVDGLTWTFDTIDSGYTFRYKLNLAAGSIVNTDVDFTVTYNGITYTFTIHFTTVDDGSKGDDGKILRPRGKFVSGETYYNNDEYRDFVIATNGKKYVVKDGVTSTTAEPPNTDYWEEGTAIDFVATKVFFSELATIDNLALNNLKAYKKNDDGSFDTSTVPVSIDGDTGVLTADGIKATNADITGKLTATSGKIAGLSISGDALTNAGFNNDAYIILRNDTNNVFAGIGGNVLPASTGTRAVARFENLNSAGYYGTTNYALIVNAKNGTNNLAIAGSGNGVLNGVIEGYMINEFTPTSSNNTISLKNGKYVVVKCTSSSYTTVYLPQKSEVCSALGISTSTHFAVEMTIVCSRSSSYGFTIYGYRTGATSCPYFINPDENQTDLSLAMGNGDTIKVLLTYDGTYYNAYLISHLD